jgi:hypothetical protein
MQQREPPERAQISRTLSTTSNSSGGQPQQFGTAGVHAHCRQLRRTPLR